MKQDYPENKYQALYLKYQPTNSNNYRHQLIWSPQTENMNSALILSQRIFKEHKQNKFSVRKVSIIQPKQQQYKEVDYKKQKTTINETKRFHMYSNSKNSKIKQLNSTANNSFYSKKSVEKQQQSSPVKPKTAITRAKQMLPQQISIVPMDIPLVSAQSWCIINGKNGQLINGHNQYKSRQMASITKIMTCWLALKLTQQFNLDLDNTYFTVPEKAERIGGTSAQLSSDDKLSIRDLLYGLMLPSGNDAAITLQYNFELKKSCDFILQMNQNALDIGMESTSYANPHGLYHETNYSSAYDIGILTYHAMQNLQFASIVKTKIYYSEIEDKFGESKEIFWENTNKMLYQGFRGVKTGITKEAGPCVVEYYEDNQNSLIIVLLNCRSVDHRWQDAFKLLDWARS
ncbi:unnamed protein product [Paramecium sonneborni]|uniref:Peptidase S11 D-alanyl-D-alanine carboxypeptidase A N-terminal domain-containing protein n=1 Tax=Paramecium sonneborni TaxID=65129 RepID=A0A8S1M6V7_9CILI|nr:unnamed protein product [Paramecium sonneborni]CAD8073645.1 unnamed protein product [Paramecium sonneborni]